MGIPYEFRVEREVHYLDAIFSAITDTQMNRERAKRSEKINISNRHPSTNFQSYPFFRVPTWQIMHNYEQKPRRVHCETVREHIDYVWFRDFYVLSEFIEFYF